MSGFILDQLAQNRVTQRQTAADLKNKRAALEQASLEKQQR